MRPLTAPSATRSAVTSMARPTSMDKWKVLLGALEPREYELLYSIGSRLLRGQHEFGPLGPKKKKWVKEGLEEIMDGMVYIGAALQDIADEEDGSD